jgi:hypothetical protein
MACLIRYRRGTLEDMSFDVYAGGFARYFAREWENVAQKHARETGMEYRIIRPGNDPGPAKWEEVQETVEYWKSVLRQGLGPNDPGDIDWNEGRDAPYFTDRPGWQGYSALVVMAACAACEEPLPDRLAEDSIVSDVVQRAQVANFQGGYQAITRVQLWLPGSFEFSFDFVDLCNQTAHVGSLRRFVQELDVLMQVYGITEEQLAAAQPGGKGETAFLPEAHFGLAVFRRVAGDAFKNRLPMMLSY